MFDAEFVFEGDTVKSVKLSLDELQMLKNVDQVCITGEYSTISSIR